MEGSGLQGSFDYRPAFVLPDFCVIRSTQVIRDYVAHTNKSLRVAVKEYFEDKAAAEQRHGKIGTWDVGRVTDMEGLFQERYDFNDPGIAAWDVSRVTTTKNMFEACSSFDADIGSWDVGRVTNMLAMFGSCDVFSGTGIGAWNTSSAMTMSYLFAFCPKFNADISALQRPGNSPKGMA